MLFGRLALERRQLLDEGVVDEAVSPRFLRLVRTNQGMLRRMVVLGRMLVRRIVTTAHVPTREAQPEVHPLGAGCQALAATLRARAHWLAPCGPFQVRATRSHVRRVRDRMFMIEYRQQDFEQLVDFVSG